MNTYRIIDVDDFPILETGQVINSSLALTLPGFTENTETRLKIVDKTYHGFEYFEFYHEILIKDSGIAYGFLDGKPIKLDFQGFKKGYTIKAYLKREQNYIYISQSSAIVDDLIKKLKTDRSIKCKLNEIELDLKEAGNFVTQFKGAWFRSISSKISSSALFGADIKNEPLFEQLQNEGASLTSITIPFGVLTIQLNSEAGISSHTRITDIKTELEIVEKVKLDLVENLRRK